MRSRMYFNKNMMQELKENFPKVFGKRKPGMLGYITDEEIFLLKENYPETFREIILFGSDAVYVYGRTVNCTGEMLTDGRRTLRATYDAIQETRFATGRGTVFDVAVWGLWEQSPPTEPMTFDEAIRYASSLNEDAGGELGWMLPTPGELCQLLIRGTHYPSIDLSLFPKCKGGLYWTNNRDRYPLVTCINFDSGTGGRFPPFYKFRVRCVRHIFPISDIVPAEFSLSPSPEEDAMYAEAIAHGN